MKFKVFTFIIALIIIFILTFLSLIETGVIDEGTEGSGIIGLISYLFSLLFNIFRFPAHTFFIEYMSGSMFLIGLMLNCIFWALIIERVFAYLKSKKMSASN